MLCEIFRAAIFWSLRLCNSYKNKLVRKLPKSEVSNQVRECIAGLYWKLSRHTYLINFSMVLIETTQCLTLSMVLVETCEIFCYHKYLFDAVVH